MRFFRNRRRMMRRRMRNLSDDRVPKMYLYEDECCSPESMKRHESAVSALSVNGTFKNRDIESVMKAVNRSHFTFHNGMKLHSRYFDPELLPTEDNDNHICFAPLRELDVFTNYAYILNALELTRGDSFLHLGSGTGYLNTLAGLLIGATGVNHGMELHEDMLAYSEERQDAFKDHCTELQQFEYCEPVFFQGDCLKLSLETRFYDRIYCSGILPDGYDFFLRIYLKPGGLLVYPKDTKTLVKIWLGPYNRYITELEPNLSVREFRVYPFTTEKSGSLTQLPDKSFPSLQELCRASIRSRLRMNVNTAIALEEPVVDPPVQEQPEIVQPEVEQPGGVAREERELGDEVEEPEVIEVDVSGESSSNDSDSSHSDAEIVAEFPQNIHVPMQQQVLERVGQVNRGFNPVEVEVQINQRRLFSNYIAARRVGMLHPHDMPQGGEHERSYLDHFMVPNGGMDRLERYMLLDQQGMEENPNLMRDNGAPIGVEHEENFEADRPMMRLQLVGRRRNMIAGHRVRNWMGGRRDPNEESSEEDNVMVTVARRVCRKCQMIKKDQKPRGPSKLNPDKPDEPGSLNFLISKLPLPKSILQYLKFKQVITRSD